MLRHSIKNYEKNKDMMEIFGLINVNITLGK